MSRSRRKNPVMDQDKRRRARIVVRELKKLFPHSQTILEFSHPWELTVAVMLSAQTADKQVNVVTSRLFKKYPALADYCTADPAEFERDLNALNYYKTKARHVLAAARMLSEEFNGILPESVSEMMRLPGVGRKTALVVLGNVYGIAEGIAVDTHVERLSKVFKLTGKSDPRHIEADLRLLIPKREWFDLTNRMIDYGRAYCPARCAHADCPILTKL